MPIVWITVVIIGLVVAIMASRGAVTHVSSLAFGTRVPPFVVGITLVAIGTDLPEIANSIIASAAKHGDLNVGDSVGSAVVQSTLVLGLLPLVVTTVAVSRRSILAAGGLTVGGLGVLAVLVGDGRITRGDGLLLLGLWTLASAVVWKASGSTEPSLRVPARRKGYHAAMAALMLGLVGGGAAAAVWAFVELAALLGVPEFLLAFFATSIGTSLPELFVDLTALRRGERDLAIGGIFGASLADSTLSVGVGPSLFPAVVTADLAVRGALVAAGAIAFVTALLAIRRRHDWRSGAVLLAVYVALYPLLLW
jgi:cation:H+ antiporter